jgi:hypothetical protein
MESEVRSRSTRNISVRRIDSCSKPFCGLVSNPEPAKPGSSKARQVSDSGLRFNVDLSAGSADHCLGRVVEGGEDLVGVLLRVVESQADDRKIDDFMTVPRSRPR